MYLWVCVYNQRVYVYRSQVLDPLELELQVVDISHSLWLPGTTLNWGLWKNNQYSSLLSQPSTPPSYSSDRLSLSLELTGSLGWLASKSLKDPPVSFSPALGVWTFASVPFYFFNLFPYLCVHICQCDCGLGNIISPSAT